MPLHAHCSPSRVKRAIAIGLIGVSLAAAAFAFVSAEPQQTYGYAVRATYPHDANAFTQGLFYRDGALIESTGLVGQSTIRRVRLEDGVVLRSVDIPASLFGEGIAQVGNELVSLTWQSGIGFRWNAETFEKIGEFNYPGEGWGLTYDGTSLVMSDGTAELRFLDPATMAERRRVTVTSRGVPVTRLNELEWVNGEIFANVWHTNFIARIDPDDGEVTSWVDLTGLDRLAGGDGRDVLNGIAYDAAGDRLLVTGKKWPRLFEIDIEQSSNQR